MICVGNMNPQLMKLIKKVEAFCDEDLLDAELVSYINTIKTLDGVDLKDPTKWPWRDKTNGYVKTMRMLIGDTPWATPVATAVVLNDSMQILLERRSDDGKWSIPGGIYEPGASIKECIVADINRETGLVASSDDLYLLDEVSGGLHFYPNGNILSSVKVIYVAKCCQGELKLNHENFQLEYFYLHQVPDNISGSTHKIVASLIDRFEEVKNW